MTTAIRHFTRTELEQTGVQVVGDRIRSRSDQLITQVSAIQNFAFGASKRIGPSIYRYGLAGGVNVPLGVLCQAPIPAATETGLVPAASYIAGTRRVILTTGGAVGLNAYAGGWMHVHDGTGQGQVLRIISHPATVGVALCAFILADPVTTAFNVADTLCALTANPYNLAIIHPAPPDAELIGVPVVAINAGLYGWFQTRGPASVLTNGTLYIYEQVRGSTTVIGAIEHANLEVIASATGAALEDNNGRFVMNSAGANGTIMLSGANAAVPAAGVHDLGSLSIIVGKVMRVNADTQYSLIDLALE